MASAYKGDDSLALGYIGEGSTAEGDFHEALTFASVYHAPVILCITNNQWAISQLFGHRRRRGDHLRLQGDRLWPAGPARGRQRFPGGLGGDANGRQSARRANLGATLIEFFTYRAAGHSTSDDPTRYRPADEAKALAAGRSHRAAEAASDRLSANGTKQRHVQFEAELYGRGPRRGEGRRGGGHAGSSPSRRCREMFEGVFEAPDWRVIEQRRELGV